MFSYTNFVFLGTDWKFFWSTIIYFIARRQERKIYSAWVTFHSLPYLGHYCQRIPCNIVKLKNIKWPVMPVCSAVDTCKSRFSCPPINRSGCAYCIWITMTKKTVSNGICWRMCIMSYCWYYPVLLSISTVTVAAQYNITIYGGKYYLYTRPYVPLASPVNWWIFLFVPPSTCPHIETLGDARRNGVISFVLLSWTLLFVCLIGRPRLNTPSCSAPVGYVMSSLRPIHTIRHVSVPSQNVTVL